jgi:antibiotic biosynthesis monooxygenase (ABM) superfamily enzyme
MPKLGRWVKQPPLPKKKSPAFRRDLLAQLGSELATALTLLIGFLALTIRVLLLLSGLLATTLLLLTGFLPRILVLLARILVLIGHRDLPC